MRALVFRVHLEKKLCEYSLIEGEKCERAQDQVNKLDVKDFPTQLFHSGFSPVSRVHSMLVGFLGLRLSCWQFNVYILLVTPQGSNS